MALHEFSENELELEAINKILELGNYQSFNGLEEKLANENQENSQKNSTKNSLGRKTTAEVVLPINLRNALKKLNPHLPSEAIDNAFNQIIEGKASFSLARANQFFYRLIKDGAKVYFKDNNGIERQETAKIIDWNRPENNDFLAVKQFKVSGEVYHCRCDLVIFINGLPLVLVELKAINKNLIDAFKDNITAYKKSIPQLFWHNALIVVSNGMQSKIGSLTSSFEHFSEWKKINDQGDKGTISLDTLIKGVLKPERLLDIVENFILFKEDKGGLHKIIAKNHQYLGVNSTIEAVKNREKLQGKLGVFWHTQGSGKSFSMVFFTQKVLRKLQGNWTFLIITDRKELDGQIYRNFANCGAVIEEEVQANSRENLKKLLSEDHRNIFAMIQKFDASFEELSDRDDIIVITDEAHRSQYNVLAMNMRKALPNASFVAFTGTPLMGDEKTKEVFGDYVSIYNFKESVEDQATVKLYYENRKPELQIINEKLDDDIDQIIQDANLSDEEEERFAKTYAKTYELITRNDRLEKIAQDVVDHFMNRGFMGKAMYVATCKATAVKMYDKVKKHWQIYISDLEKQLLTCKAIHQKTILEKIAFMKQTDMAVVVSKAQGEEENLEKKGVKIKEHRLRMDKEDLEEEFKKTDSNLRIVFVCAMWITGFDAPAVSTLYLDKILKDHTLMQTIARANRVLKDKPDGIIVDYIGIFGALQKALAVYGDAKIGDEGKAIENKEELVKNLIETSLQMEVFLQKNKVNLTPILQEKDNFKKIELVEIAVDKILENEEGKKEFLNLARNLKVLLKGVLPDARAERYLPQILAIAIIAAKIAEYSAPLTPEEKEEEKRKIADLSQRVSRLLDDSIAIDDFEIEDSKPFDLSQINFEELKARFNKGEKQKTTVERLKSAIAQKIEELMKVNPTRESYSDKFAELIVKYNSGEIETDKLFLELVNFSRGLNEEETRHIRENLSEEELVIFDILTNPQPKLSKTELEEVKKVAKELLEKLKTGKLVIDWKSKQSARAKVVSTIENVCDQLPEAYDSNIFKNKCNDLYLYFYDNYPSAECRF